VLRNSSCDFLVRETCRLWQNFVFSVFSKAHYKYINTNWYYTLQSIKCNSLYSSFANRIYIFYRNHKEWIMQVSKINTVASNTREINIRLLMNIHYVSWEFFFALLCICQFYKWPSVVNWRKLQGAKKHRRIVIRWRIGSDNYFAKVSHDLATGESIDSRSLTTFQAAGASRRTVESIASGHTRLSKNQMSSSTI